MGEKLISAKHNIFKKYRNMNLVNPYIFSAYKQEFVYSTYKVVPTATKSIVCRNEALATTKDIGFSGNVIDTTDITSFSAGTQSYCVLFYDQVNGLINLNPGQPNQIGYFPLTSNASGIGINYLNDVTNTGGVVWGSTHNFDISKDLVFQFVMSNATSTGDGSCSFHIKTAVAGKQGVFTVHFRLVGTDYVVSIKHDYSTISNSTAQLAFILPRGTNNTDFNLFTFTKIQGVVKMYKDGVEITATTTPGAVYYGSHLISVGVGNLTNNLSGCQQRVKTFSLISGNNLTSFNLTASINYYKSLHGI